MDIGYFRSFVTDCKSTMLPTSDNFEYLAFGLLSELGEVAGVLKKYIRGDYDSSTFADKFESEIGDVWWYVAMIAYKTNPNNLDQFVDSFVEGFPINEKSFMDSYLIQLFQLSSQIAQSLLNSQTWSVGSI
jgi:NTP pyrophosphatase (non-canonical NTP hydrolase)